MPRVARGHGQAVLQRRGGDQQIRPAMAMSSGKPTPASGGGNLDRQDPRRKAPQHLVQPDHQALGKRRIAWCHGSNAALDLTNCDHTEK